MKKFLIFALISLTQINFCGELIKKSDNTELTKREDKIYTQAVKDKNKCKENCNNFIKGFCIGFVPGACLLLAYNIAKYCCLQCTLNMK